MEQQQNPNVEVRNEKKTVNLHLEGEENFFVQEAYKYLRTNLQFSGKEVRVIGITSCNENEGKTTISLHLAKCFSDLGLKVLLLDADMRKSVISARHTDAVSPAGLSEVLTGLGTFEDCRCATQYENLDILFAGKFPPNPSELLNSPYFGELIADLRTRYDYVIIDTPPLGAVTDAAIVAKETDGMALVISNRKLPAGEARNVVSILQSANCRILGVIRSHAKSGKSKRYGKYGKEYQS